MLKLFLIVLLSIALFGCAQAVPSKIMVPSQSDMNNTSVMNGKFYKSISIGEVDGGEKTNPLHRSEIENDELEQAIKVSLEINNYLSSEGYPTKYKLDVFLLEVDRPRQGFTITITTFIRYKLTDTTNNVLLFDTICSASDTKTFGDASIASTRFIIAQGDSIKKNISQLLSLLYKMNNN